ncbi:unnamed protein product [Adineta ricciae]|uniref:Uncharacterized protein n=1 Tax=Adineta ricciae TaxID=249248 RepID=A0A815BCH7_ADIRI|nr:unnamed protein product [Adineta ricciae]CAF1270568.1 unnamed protein product [Adineta ricciae]
MNSPLFTVLLLILGVVFFQPTHQYRLSKREITEDVLFDYIVKTCSADNTAEPFQKLCDQTLRSALMGAFQPLTNYCQQSGAGMRYCKDLNRQMVINQNARAKKFLFRRLARTVHEDQEMNTEPDLEQELIMQMCIIETGKNSVDMNQFCERKASEIQQGQFPRIELLCKSYPDSRYCQQIQAYVSLVNSVPSFDTE